MAIDGTLGILGFGNMGQAIVRGLIKKETLGPDRMAAFDVDGEKQDAAQALGISAASSMEDLASRSQTLLLSVKPQSFGDVADATAASLPEDALVVSIMAGVSIAGIQAKLGAGRRVVRTMPNLPAVFGAGAAGVAFSDNCTDADREAAQAMFEAVGTAEFVPESAIDTITALSGSGPAYFFRVVECLVQAATDLGLPEDQAARLAAQTALGAAIQLRDSGESASTLRERVTSKGGTTAAALAAFDEKNLAGVIAAGVQAAAARSKELGQ
ncbi:MAG: pyrroline-5-carboxylate reductase [bacterium]|nr:pyrroline-5-carboxylate reductase [bacterium]